MEEEELYLVTLEYYRNHSNSEKYKRAQLFKLHLIQNSPPVQLYTAVSHCKVVGNILEAILFKPFQLFRCILNYVSSITKGHNYLSYI
jgi:hypothetical protein